MKPAGCVIALILLLFLAMPGIGQAQVSNLRVRRVPVRTDSLRIDTLSIVPGTVSIAGIDASDYRVDAPQAILYWLRQPVTDSIQISYRVFPFLMARVAQRRNFDSVLSATAIRPFTLAANERNRSLLNFGNFKYSGSFGRGIAFGNNQDAVVQSNFNLQLNGYLADSIEIAAALSDNNLPIQPDGNTQQLNEFDQVFLQFKKKNWQLNLGDMDLRQNDLYFLNFYKRLQGISFQTSQQLRPGLKSATLASGSIARGKFNRNILQGLEGNQGPYRLTGANNEFFFIVLANTERVFIDGELLERGEDRDYTINYNTAELTFMPRRMITKDSRIQVEFEYADRNYLNANLYLNQSVSVNEKLKIRLGAFTNSDARNAPINQPLTPAQKQFLIALGDSTSQALFPNIAVDSFSREKVLYEKVYFQNGSRLDSFYRYSTNPDSARYTLSFTELGQGRGDYMPDFNGANGKVFRYLPRVNGMMQGRYAPVQQLVAPRKQQLLSLGADYSPNQHHQLQMEMALSAFDANTFSSIGNGDDQAVAVKLGYNNKTSLGGRRKTELVSTLHAEHVQAQFRPLERLRSVEFSRDWGLPLLLAAADETIVRAGTGIKTSKGGTLNYQFTTYNRGGGYQGRQHQVQQQGALAGWQLRNSLIHTTFSYAGNGGTFFRPVFDLQKRFSRLKQVELSMRYLQERNKVGQLGKDSLSPLSFAFDTYTASLRTNSERQNRYGLTFFTRGDQLPSGQQLARADRSYNLNLQAELLSNPRHQLVVNTTYRQLRIIDKGVSRQQPDATLLGRAEYQVNEWKGLLTGSLLYELGTGQEQRRDLTYIEVPAGQGSFAWFDYNNDGVQQLNEFETAQFRDQARFVRIMVPTNEFVKAAYTTLNYSLNITPKAILDPTREGALHKVLSLLAVQTALQTNRKVLAGEGIEVSPFGNILQDSTLVALNTTVSGNLSVNRLGTRWGIDLGSLRTNSRALLTYGLESRQVAEWNLRGRVLITKMVSLELLARNGKNGLFTPAFENRNYDLVTQVVEPKLSFLSGTVLRVQGSYRYENKENAAAWGGQRSRSHALQLDSRYNVLQNSSVSGRFVYNKLDYNGATNTPIAYTMLDALLPGKNFLWNLELTKRLLNNVELSFHYDGRQPARARTIHTGRASLRALF